MHVVKKLRSPKAPNIYVAQFIMTVSYHEVTRRIGIAHGVKHLLITVYGVVSIYADRQRFESLRHRSFLFYYMSVRHRH